jgi:glycosyltransferase involved in cell wall biosynthesis
MNKKPSSSILALIPAHNEVDHIDAVVRAAVDYLPVLVVDDGSSDDTQQVARAAGAEVYRQVPNKGKGAALLLGFGLALAQGCAGVITLDADGQHDPTEIPLFLEKITDSHPDLIIGARNFRQMPFQRRFANTFGGMVFSLAMGRTIRDNQSGYRYISRRLMETMLSSGEQGFEFEVEMIVLCARNKMQIDWIPIRTIYADEKSHIQPGKHVIKFLKLCWRTWKSMHLHSINQKYKLS